MRDNITSLCDKRIHALGMMKFVFFGAQRKRATEGAAVDQALKVGRCIGSRSEPGQARRLNDQMCFSACFAVRKHICTAGELFCTAKSAENGAGVF